MVVEKLLAVLAVVVHLMVALVVEEEQTLDLEHLFLLELLGQVSMVHLVEKELKVDLDMAAAAVVVPVVPDKQVVAVVMVV